MFSTVLLAVTDASYQFIVIDVGSMGRFSDRGVFQTSAFGQHLKNETLDLPQDAPLETSKEIVPFVFVGDEAFPLQAHVMRPYPRVQLTNEKRIFNYRLSRARRVVENSFGILAVRWRIYKRLLESKISTVDKIVKATCVLHNYIGIKNGHHITDDEIKKN